MQPILVASTIFFMLFRNFLWDKMRRRDGVTNGDVVDADYRGGK